MSEEPSEVLSVVASDEGNELSVHMTLAGLDTLIAHLSLLRRSFDKEGDIHRHLMSEMWLLGTIFRKAGTFHSSGNLWPVLSSYVL